MVQVQANCRDALQDGTPDLIAKVGQPLGRADQELRRGAAAEVAALLGGSGEGDVRGPDTGRRVAAVGGLEAFVVEDPAHLEANGLRGSPTPFEYSNARGRRGKCSWISLSLSLFIVLICIFRVRG